MHDATSTHSSCTQRIQHKRGAHFSVLPWLSWRSTATAAAPAESLGPLTAIDAPLLSTKTTLSRSPTQRVTHCQIPVTVRYPVMKAKSGWQSRSLQDSLKHQPLILVLLPHSMAAATCLQAYTKMEILECSFILQSDPDPPQCSRRG